MKKENIEFCVSKVKEMLEHLRPGHGWDVQYVVDHGEYFYIITKDGYRYIVDVTADNVLTAIYELMYKLAMKW